eukprot:PITA_30662
MLPPSICALQQLKFIDISLCGSSHGLGKGHDFPKSPKFQEINFDHCSDLEELPGNICNLTYLQKLSVTNCHLIQKLPDDFGRLRSFKDLPMEFDQLSNLKIFDMRECSGLKKLPKALAKLRSLKCVICDESTEREWLAIKASTMPNLIVEVIE